MEFTQEAPNTRLVQTRRDDTLQRVALREMGDASLWAELAIINRLKPPYLVNTRAEAVDGVIAAGDSIAIPAPVAAATVATDPDAVFLRDLLLDKGKLAAEGGALKLAGGLDNFKQAILIRLTTSMRELPFHPDYGCWASTLIGAGNNAAAGQLAAYYVKTALSQDDRVAAIPDCTATVAGDSLSIEATVNPITGRAIDIFAVL
jgi:hypothetical protein